MVPIFTKKEAEKIINAEGSVEISLDLGISLITVQVKEGFVHIKKEKVPVSEFERVKEDTCYVLEKGSLQKLALFSDETNLYYKLVPTIDWPTITLSSVPMHRHTKVSPKQDTLLKIREISPVKGKVLDTCCGLGYTSILASKEADEVYTFERDKNILRIAGLNPYSQELFNNKKIKISQKDIFEAILSFKNNFFDRIVHDPPTFKQSPLLYSEKFYLEMFRVLKKGGVVYHYAPWPGKTKGEVFYKRIIRNLKECGFKQVEYKIDSCGVRAVKF